MTALVVEDGRRSMQPPRQRESHGPWLVVSLCTLLVLAAALLSVVLPFATMGFDIEKSYNEGWNAYHAARVSSGEVLYTGDPARLVNYPFLSFYLVAWLKPLFGNVLLIGRGLNIIAFLATGILSALIVRCLRGSIVEMMFASACVLGFQAIQAKNWIGTDEPQMVAEALMLGGLFCYVSGRPTLLRLAGCALLLSAGAFVKHILVAIPLAISLDLLFKDRRHFLVWCACGSVSLLLFACLSEVIAGGHFWNEIFAPRIYHWSRLSYHGKKLLIAFKWPIIAVLVYLSRRLPRSHAVLLRTYGGVALISGVFFSGGDGVANNIYLDFTVFMGLAAGVALGQWRRSAEHRGFRAIIASALPLLLALPVLTKSPQSVRPLLDAGATFRAYRQQEADFNEAKDFLRNVSGPIICENLLLCFEAGKPLIVDPFNARSQILVGRLSEASMITDVARRRFEAIELSSEIHPDPEHPRRIDRHLLAQARFTEGTLDAIDRFYTPAIRTNGAIFFFPRPYSARNAAEGSRSNGVPGG